MAISLREAEKRVKAWEKKVRVKKKPPAVVKREKKVRKKRKKKEEIRLKLSMHRYESPRPGTGRWYWKYRIHAVPQRIKNAEFRRFSGEIRGDYIYIQPA